MSTNSGVHVISEQIKLATASLFENSRQEVLFIKEHVTLFVLFRIAESDVVKNLNGAVISKKRHIVDCTVTHPFFLSALLSSKGNDKETLKRLRTKSVMQEGRPIWFYEPNQNNRCYWHCKIY